jgi:thiol-disulfide isomerase/thioredoxin
MTPLGKSILAMFVLFLVLLGVLWFSLEYQRDNPLKYNMQLKPNYRRLERMDQSVPSTISQTPVQPSSISQTPAQPSSVSQTQASRTTLSPPTASPVPPTSTPYTLYYFYSPTCKPCAAFSPIWNKIVQTKDYDFSLITFQAIDVTDPKNEDLIFYYNVKKTPTIIMSTPYGTEELDDISYPRLVKLIHERIKNIYDDQDPQ